MLQKVPSLFSMFVFPFHRVEALVSSARQPLTSQAIKGAIFLTFLPPVSSQRRRLKGPYATRHLCADSVLATLQDRPHERVQSFPDKGSWPLVTWKRLRNAKCSSFQPDRLQLNRKVDYHLCQLSGARKWVLAAKSLAYLQQMCFPWSTFCECNCLKIHPMGWKPDHLVTYLNLNLEEKANNLKNSHNMWKTKIESTQRNKYQMGTPLWQSKLVLLSWVRWRHLCSINKIHFLGITGLQLGWPGWSTDSVLQHAAGLMQRQELGDKAHL